MQHGENIIIPLEYRGQRFDRVLAALFPQYSRAKLTSWLKQGLIFVEQAQYQPDTKVRGEEALCFKQDISQKENPVAAQAIPLDIVYEDEHVLVINKPAGLVVHPGAGHFSNTLMNALLHHASSLSALPRAGIVHRLDKETTGLLLVGKTVEAYTHLVRQLQARTIHREYFALVFGAMTGGGTVSTQYGRDPKNRLKMAVLKQGKDAVTYYTIKHRYPGATLLNVTLLTGRTHQIRVHMAHLKHAIVGDPLYARQPRLAKHLSEATRLALMSFQRQALHAYRLTFEHPVTQTNVVCSAPIPEDFQTLLSFLENTHDAPDCELASS